MSTPGTLVGGGGSGSEVLPARRLSTEDEIEKAFEVKAPTPCPSLFRIESIHRVEPA